MGLKLVDNILGAAALAQISYAGAEQERGGGLQAIGDRAEAKEDEK